jgi:hypothetical protein
MNLSIQILQTILKIEYEYDHAYFLDKIVPDLTQEVVHKLYQMLKSKKYEYENARIKALSVCIPYLEPELRYQEVEFILNLLENLEEIDNEEALVYVMIKLAPYVESDKRADILDQAAIIATLTDDSDFRMFMLITLIPHRFGSQRVDILYKAYESARNISNQIDRGKALGALAPYLPEELLLKTIEMALTIDYDREKLLEILGGELVKRGIALTDLAYEIWVNILQQMSRSNRPKFLRDLAALMPFILALAGDEAPQTAEGIYQAIQDVCGWWP